MNLKEEYLKRVDIIKSKQDIRKKKIKLYKLEKEELILQIKEKITLLNLQSEKAEKTINKNNELLLKQKEKYDLFETNFLFKLDKIDNNYNKQLLDNKNYHLEEEAILLQQLEEEKNRIFEEKNDIMKQFELQNKCLIDKKKKYETEIIKFTELLKRNKQLLKYELKAYKSSIGNRFSNRNKNISKIEEYHILIKENRQKKKYLYEKIRKKELELRSINSENEYINRQNLSFLNSYIKSQRMHIRNEVHIDKKKEYFDNIKKKNLEYTNLIDEHKKNRYKLENEISFVKKELVDIRIINFIQNVKNVNTNVNDINDNNTNVNINDDNNTKDKQLILEREKEIEELTYNLTSLQIEYKSVNILLDENRYKYEEKIDYIDKNNNKEHIKLLLVTNQEHFKITNEKLLNEQSLECIENKKMLKQFLLDTIYPLFIKKTVGYQIRHINEKIDTANKILRANTDKIKNNNYILERIELKYEITKMEKEEKDNLLTIDELLEIEELNQKILSL
jgi:hypothetical protein